jgi:hypothetical protein
MAEKEKTPYYFPSKEADVVPWIRNFVAVLAAGEPRAGVSRRLW